MCCRQNITQSTSYSKACNQYRWRKYDVTTIKPNLYISHKYNRTEDASRKIQTQGREEQPCKHRKNNLRPTKSKKEECTHHHQQQSNRNQ